MFLDPNKRNLYFGLVILIVINTAWTSSNINAPLNSSKTLREAEIGQLEQEMHRIIQSEKGYSTTFPRPCISDVDSSDVCQDSSRLNWKRESQNASLNTRFQIAGEYRNYQDIKTETIEGGGVLWGNLYFASFFLDLRLFTDIGEVNQGSYDGLPVDRQTEGDLSKFTFTSYARFKANLNFDTKVGRFSFARGTPSWGPSVFHQLTFSHSAIPYNYMTYSVNLGPLKVTSLMGDLAIDGVDGDYRKIEDTRTIYGHRYELSLFKNILFGISETLLLYNGKDFLAMVPFIPLFIEKGYSVERNNNGNIAFDLSYRFPGLFRIYTEFLIDDVYELSSIFNDFWGNRWAWTIGTHWVKDILKSENGLIVEYSRVEPWTYVHYKENTLQMAHRGKAIANPSGSNSQTISTKIYNYWENGLGIDFKTEVLWKGNDEGSNILDTVPLPRPDKKEFLKGIKKPQVTLSPVVNYNYKFFNVELWCDYTIPGSWNNQVKAKNEFEYFARMSFYY